jgi:hypothetical protein
MRNRGLINCLEEILIDEFFVPNPVHFGPTALRPRQAGLKRRARAPSLVRPACSTRVLMSASANPPKQQFQVCPLIVGIVNVAVAQ